jgi:uncharacterized protein Yka (UPF0111/DUF47 family)
MSFTLLRPELPFLALFQAHMRALVGVATLLDELLAGRTEVASACQRIHELAGEDAGTAERVTHELSLTTIRPQDRDDVFELNLGFDAAIKAIRGIATRIGLHPSKAPRGSARELAGTLRETVEQVDRLLALIGRGATPKPIMADIDRIGAEAEGFLVVGLGDLYESGASKPDELIEVFVWAQLHDRLEDALGRVRHVANLLSLILLKAL